MDIHCFANGEKNDTSFRESFGKYNLGYSFISFYRCSGFFKFYSAIFFLDPTLLFDHCYADLNIAGNMPTINGIKTNKLNTDTVHFLAVHRFE